MPNINNLSSVIRAVRDVLLYILMFVMAIAYHPTIIRMSHLAGYESGTILSRYIILLFGVVLLFSLSLSAFRNSKLVTTYLIWLIIITIIGGFILAFFQNSKMISELRSFVIVLGAILIGYDTHLNRERFIFFLLAFCITILFSGVMQVLYNIGGFQIEDQYLADAKNSLGAMLASSSFTMLYLHRVATKKFIRLLLLIGILVSVFVILTIRARMAFVALFLVMGLYFFIITRNKNVLLLIIAAVFAVFLMVIFMPESLRDYVEASFTAGTQEEDFTSGRTVVYYQALSYLAQHPLLGDVQQLNRIAWIHNFPLLNLYNYGLLFSWPILVLYVYLLVRVIRFQKHSNPLSRTCFGATCLLIPYLISMAEPTFPFGPGTVTVFNFILLGMAEREYGTISN